MSVEAANAFISRWSKASPSERANSQLFLSELCDLLGVAHPDPSRDNGYGFEYEVKQFHADGTSAKGRIDLYKRGCFVLESKQFQAAKALASQLELAAREAGLELRESWQPYRGSEAWDDAMIKARGQAERYVRSLPASEPNPPFLIVVDVGHSFEVFADFTQAGKAYLPFPDPRTFRIRLEQLADEKIRERLKLIWTDPGSLDPARHSADVTLAVSGHLAELAKSLEADGHKPRVVADFLTRCLFCMFAEDVGLLPENAFTELLKSIPDDGTGFKELLEQLFRELDTGTGKGISVVLRKKLLQFNGGLFSDYTALPVNRAQLYLLKAAALQNWRNVEPAIFGTLLERGLNPRERHKLGAHYTLAPTSNASSCPLSSNRCAPNGKASALPPSRTPAPAISKRPAPRSTPSTIIFARSRFSIPPAVRAISSTLLSNISSGSKAKSSMWRPRSAKVSNWSSPRMPLTRTSFSASKSILAPPRSPNSFFGSATSNGTSALADANPFPKSPS